MICTRMSRQAADQPEIISIEESVEYGRGGNVSFAVLLERTIDMILPLFSIRACSLRELTKHPSTDTTAWTSASAAYRRIKFDVLQHSRP